jgi:hypothetical protein
MRDLKDNIIETVVVVPYERMIAKKRRERRGHIKKLGAEASASWHARLPAPKVETDGAFHLCSTTDTSLQKQSLFFEKLPLELRRFVYAYAMGGEELQLELREDGDKTIPFKMRCAEAQSLLVFPGSCKIA